MNDLVVCLQNSHPMATLKWGVDPAVKEEIYTVRGSANDDINGDACFLLYEIRCHKCNQDGSEWGYQKKYFRPLRDESLDVFRSTDKQFRETIEVEKVDA